MARKPKPSIPRREVAVDRDSWIGRARLLALKNMLGLGLTPEEEAFLGPMPRVAVFTPEDVIALLGDGERGIPRMLPVDVALGRLGMPIIRVGPDGMPRRLWKDFPKAWAARVKSDRAIAAYVARTCREVPRGWYPDREWLLMSAAERADDEIGRLGPQGSALVAELAPYFRFDLVPAELRLAGYQMWMRRRLAGIAPLAGPGLALGYWDDAMSAYDVNAWSFRGIRAAVLAARVAVARELAFAAVAAGAAGSDPFSIVDERYVAIHGDFSASALWEDPLGPSDPDRRSLGGGFAELHRQLATEPGAVWSGAAVAQRPEGLLNFPALRNVFVDDPAVLSPGYVLPDNFVAGGLVPESPSGWMADFVSA